MMESTQAPRPAQPNTAPDRWATDHIARTQTCPLCFGDVTGHNTRKCGRAMLATYTCDMGHLWNLSWVLGQVTA